MRAGGRTGTLDRVSVLVIGRVRPSRRGDVDALLADPDLGARAYTQGDTVALVVEGPRPEARFLRLLEAGTGPLVRLLDCLEEVPLLPREVRAEPGDRRRAVA